MGITSLSPALIVFSSFGAEPIVENLYIYIFSHLFAILNQYNFIYWLKWFLFLRLLLIAALLGHRWWAQAGETSQNSNGA